MKRIATSPWDAKRQGFWKIRNFAHWYNRALWEQRRYGNQRPTNKMGYKLAKSYDMIPDYVPGQRYTNHELELMADFMIFEHSSWTADGSILSYDMLKRRKIHEIYTNAKAPDPSLFSGLFWRTHPQGLKWRTAEERKPNGASFYMVG